MGDKKGRLRNYAKKAWDKRGYISNGKDLETAGKIGAAGGVAYLAHYFTKKAADGLKEYTPGRVIKKVVTKAEKGVYDIDQTIEKKLSEIPGGKEVIKGNKGLVDYVWTTIGITPGGKNQERAKSFYERHKIPMPYTKTEKTITETRVPPTYNTDAANQKTLLGTAGFAINALLGLYVAKEGAKHFYNKVRGRKK